MIYLGSVSWGSGPAITMTFYYEKYRSGANMVYRGQVVVGGCSGSSRFGYPIYAAITINGGSAGSATMKGASPSQWSSGAYSYTTPWYTVSNKTSGSTGISFNIYSGSGSSRNSTYSYSMGVDPAGSVFGTVDNGTLGAQQTINVTRYSTSFTHTITYSCGTKSGTICEKSSNTAISWTPPKDLAEEAPNDTSVSVKLTMTTYSGNSTVGSSATKTINCSIPDNNDFKPTVSIATSDTMGYLATYGGYVEGQSKLKVDLTTSGKYNSTIKLWSISVESNGSSTNASYTTEAIKGQGTIDIDASTTDSRGRIGTASEPITVIPYSVPSLTVSSKRCNADGVANSSGEYLSVNINCEVAPVNNHNTATYTVKYKKTTDTEYSQPATLDSLTGQYNVTDGTYIFAADTGSTYDIEVTAIDSFTSIPKNVKGSAVGKVWSYYRNGAGMAIGKPAELENKFEVDWESKFNKNSDFDGRVRLAIDEDFKTACDVVFPNLVDTTYPESLPEIEVNAGIQNFINLLYPIGHILENTTSSFDPNTTYPWQTWENISSNNTTFKMDELWTNPNPNVDFAAQNITTSKSLANYDYLGLVLKLGASWRVQNISLAPLTDTPMCFGVHGAFDNGTLYVRTHMRNISKVNNTTLSISVGYYIASGGNTGTSATDAVPYKIYGINSKYGLFPNEYRWRRTS